MAPRKNRFITRKMNKRPAEVLVSGVLLALVLWGVGFLFGLFVTPGVAEPGMLQSMFALVRDFLQIIAGLILLAAVLQYLLRGALLKR
ncbi:hypothetical protein ACFOD1_02775 [Pseudidiomarina halophila]|uniref:Uncharacterized protein n=1 Tax=Pseudidiomarina halophila TaxID=1449799 RepID=A0A432XYR9_9GAMM|nr:hypothetical protein [Pseudidiomarina halophila]RUO53882.1 hypothetical protein CWI69_00110 [Pseudidiomarina halophila]